MNRVITYVDGFNLYFGLREKNWRRYYWLDLVGLSTSFLRGKQRLVHCHYFTARIRNRTGTEDARRQNTYLDALGTLRNLTIHFGHYLAKPRRCKVCGATWTHYEEKMSDVNLAVQLLTDAYDDHFDTAIIVSGDGDLTTPVRQVRQRFPRKRVLIAFPPARRSDQLRGVANGSFVIGQDKLRNNQLPDIVTTPSGHPLHRPAWWR
ncbi:MAG: NYN domain-containing protein [Deltaproteobacteria bacterium]|nr:MAG: NYN domain-containing protein [Deltaproteobacteria bacterium]